MAKIYEKLGNTVRKYRKANHYSTFDLADKLNISSGLVNNLENAKNDVFKLELLINLINELHIPVEELLQLDEINIRQIHIKNNETLFIQKTENESEETIEFINHHLNLILKSFLYTALEYSPNKEVIESISSDITTHLKTIRNLKQIV